MCGAIRDMAIRDLKRFSQAEHSSDIYFVDENVTVQGFMTNHNLSIDPLTGESVASQNVHISINESVMNEAGITTRDNFNKIVLKGKKVKITDGSGVENTYIIDEVYANNTFGFIVMILGIWH